jgi:phosphoenolpyruvate---glycerone phosphotransferase subunit DhaL
MDSTLSKDLIETVARRIIAAAAELTALDQAIGDGDHGINMRRGMEAVLADIEKLSGQPLNEALKAAGMTLVMKVGGASGPLYGTLLMTLGKELNAAPGYADVVSALGAAIDAVKVRGKSERGQKTMLDVLIPVHELLSRGPCDYDALRRMASEAAKATIPMKAIRGRASFLGDRSIGHMDPGARSTEIMAEAIADVLGGKP